MISRKVSDARLLKLAAFLKNLPRKRFDYTSWVGEGFKGAPDLSCGTTACALGWAATMPEFKRLGLYIKVEKGFDSDGLPEVYGYPALKRERCIEGDAGQVIFGLDSHEAYFLFHPMSGESNATPKYVARKIEAFVKQRHGPGYDSYNLNY